MPFRKTRRTMQNSEVKRIPVIDLFAGPGGLSEGFAASIGEAVRFETKLSIEKQHTEFLTLSLRAFYRQFIYRGEPIPQAYYDYVKGKIRRSELFDQYPRESGAAESVAWQCTLGGGGK